MEKQEVIFTDLGIMDYETAWNCQEKLLNENIRVKSSNREASAQDEVRRQDSTTNHLLFVEHPAVFTLGKAVRKGIS